MRGPILRLMVYTLLAAIPAFLGLYVTVILTDANDAVAALIGMGWGLVAVVAGQFLTIRSMGGSR